MTNVYCDSDDVKRILQLDFTLSTTSRPTLADVQEFIEEAQDEIDQRTNNAWREKTVTEEYYDIPRIPYNYQTGIPIHLKHAHIRDFDDSEGDKIEIWDGSSWVDWLTTKTEGRANDYWLENKKGVLYLRYPYRFYGKQAVRLTYRYGHDTVPKDIQKATALLAATSLLLNDDRSAALIETGDSTRMNYDQRINVWKTTINRAVRNHYVMPVF